MASKNTTQRVEMDSNTAAMAEKFEKAMEKYPFEVSLVTSLISKNVLNGCSWEFESVNDMLRTNLGAISKNPNCSAQKVTFNHEKGIYGYLVFMKIDYLLKLLSPANCGPLNDEDIQYALKHRDDAKKALITKIKKGYRGKIGIFCTNDSQNITIDGKTFPAYAITLKELCVICENMGYGIVIGKGVRNPQDVLAREDGVIEKATIAPSRNALLIEIAPMTKG